MAEANNRLKDEFLMTESLELRTPAGTLQKAGLITYRRGHPTVVDRENLEAASCECYQTATALLKAVTRRRS